MLKIRNFLILSALFSITSGIVAQQNLFPKDTIQEFHLKLLIEYFPDYRTMDITIDENGLVICTYVFYDLRNQVKDTISDKRIFLDHNTFRQVKEKIASLDLFKLPTENDNSEWEDGQNYELQIIINEQKTTLKGRNRDENEESFKFLLEFLDSIVGFKATDFDKY